jgi:hypothetical protein
VISPSPIEAHLDIVRALGSRTQPLDAIARRGFLRRRRERAADALGAITIRPAAARDAAAVALLAMLAGQRLLGGRRLVADAEGRSLAATEIASGRTVADPFEPTAGIAQLVALRAQQLRP